MSLDTAEIRKKLVDIRYPLCIFLALIVRLIYNSQIIHLPLYQYPLGGHTIFIEYAEKILAGDLNPTKRVFTDNSPYYPYLLSVLMLIFGAKNYLLIRLFGAMADLITIYLIGKIADKKFNSESSFFSMLLYALYGPAIYLSVELIYSVYAVLLVALIQYLIIKGDENCSEANKIRTYAPLGIILGILVGIMPSSVLIVPLLIIYLKVKKVEIKNITITVLLFFITIFPIAVLNYKNSKSFTLLTTGFGHNFYIGHNKYSKVGYYLPEKIGEFYLTSRGNIFDNMKKIAEEGEGRTFQDSQVSSYFFKKAIGHIVEHPAEEFKLLCQRMHAFLNIHEATTYVNYYFQSQNSKLLQYTVQFNLLLFFSVFGILHTRLRDHLDLVIPIIITLLTILIFFYLTRFRIIMIPTLVIYGGVGIAVIKNSFLKNRVKFFTKLGIAFLFLGISSFRLVKIDLSNEWNKVGAVYLKLQRLKEAKEAFYKSLSENSSNSATYLNLALVLNKEGNAEEADKMKRQAELIIQGNQGNRAADFIK